MHYRIALFYCFTPLADPHAMCLWQRELGSRCGVRGRIIVSPQGINATVGGDIDDVRAYVRGLKEYEPFRNISIKWSDGDGEAFPKLKVTVKPELVAFGVPNQITVTDEGVVGTGERLSPDGLHELAAQEDIVFFDGRNDFEAVTGRFQDAIIPDVQTSRDFPEEIKSGKYDHLKDTPIVTYCTGGVRCEVLSALFKQNGFQRVYQLHGGIMNYGKKYGHDGLWNGELYSFDGRGSIKFSDDATSLGNCSHCHQPTGIFRNCSVDSCNEKTLFCHDCDIEASECRICHSQLR